MGYAALRTVPRRRFHWRVVDIVVTAVIAVACSVVFSLWDLLYQVPSNLAAAALPGFQGIVNGPWLLAGVLAAVIVRKPGAALFAELVAGSLEALVGSQWGPLTVVSGAVQGLGAEVAFALLAYRVWRPWSAALAGALAGLFGGVYDLIASYAKGLTPPFATAYLVSGAVSGAVVAGLVGWAVARALARTGVLDRFASGREVAAEA